MNLQALTERATNGEVRELEQLSLEGDFYLARVRIDQGQFTLLDELKEAYSPSRHRSHSKEILRIRHRHGDGDGGYRAVSYQPLGAPWSTKARQVL